MNLPVKPKLLVWLVVLLGIVSTLVYNRRPVVIPGNDQGAYMAMGASMAGGPYAIYGGSWPPLYPFAGSLLLRLSCSGLLSFHLVCLVSFVGLILLLFQISDTLQMGSAPVFVTVTCATIFAYGWTEMSEMPFTLFATAAIWTFLRATDWRAAVLSAIFVVLSYETRYAGQFLLLAMSAVILVDYLSGHPVRQKITALLLGVIGIVAATLFNAWLYNYASANRPPSSFTFSRILYDLGLALWMVWLGDGPVSKVTFLSGPLAFVSLLILAYFLFTSFKRDPRIRAFSIVIISYLTMLVAAEHTVALDSIHRRLLLPVVPLAILLGFDKLRERPRWIPWVLAASTSLGIAHMIKGRVA